MPSISAWREAAEGLRHDLDGVVGPRLRSLVAYEAHHLFADRSEPVPTAGKADIHQEGLLHTVAVVDSLAVEDLRRLAALAPAWQKRRLAVPLFLAPRELGRSLDAFPLEFSQILARYVVVFGADPFAGVRVEPNDLRRACETQVKSHALHLREGYLQSGSDAKKVGALVTASAAPLRALLVNIARLHGAEPGSPDDLLAFLQQRLAVSVDGLRPVLQLGTPGTAVRGTQAADAFFPYLQAIEDLARLVDEWTL